MIVLLLLLPQDPVPQARKVPEAVVLVQGRAMAIPGLPDGFQDARKRNGEVQARIAQHLEAVDTLLRETSVRAPAAQGRLAVPPARAEEARRLLALLQDGRYAVLEAAVAEALKAWEQEAREARSHAPKGSPRLEAEAHLPDETRDPVAYLPSRSGLAAQDRPKASGGASHVSAEFGLTDAAALAANGEALKLTVHEAGEMVRHFRGGKESVRVVAATEDRMPRLRQDWDLLVEHLRASGLSAEEPVGPGLAPEAPAILELQRRLRLQFLQRTRANLLLCAALWAALAS